MPTGRANARLMTGSVSAGTLLRVTGTRTLSCFAYYVAVGPGSAAHRFCGAQRPGHETHQVMNMRAAEAIVSSAPNPMKIFPIREV